MKSKTAAAATPITALSAFREQTKVLNMMALTLVDDADPEPAAEEDEEDDWCDNDANDDDGAQWLQVLLHAVETRERVQKRIAAASRREAP